MSGAGNTPAVGLIRDPVLECFPLLKGVWCRVVEKNKLLQGRRGTKTHSVPESVKVAARIKMADL